MEIYNTFQIAIDSGKSYTKGVIRNEQGIIERVKFRTKVAEVDSNFGVDISNGNHLVEYNGKIYLVGDMLGEERLNYDYTKQTTENLISIYLAIVQLLEKSGLKHTMAKVNLSLNIPLSHYRNETLKKDFEKYIRNEGKPIGMAVNGKPFAFVIDSVLLLPEALGPVYQNMRDYRNKRVVIFDIGSLNTSILEFNNLVPQYDRMAVSTSGINILRSAIAETLSARYGTTISDDDAEQILRDRCLYQYGQKQEESERIIEQALINHVKTILNFAKSRKISFSNVEIVLCGGGSIILMQYLLQELPYATVITDAQFANVLSFLQVLEAKHHGKA